MERTHPLRCDKKEIISHYVMLRSFLLPGSARGKKLGGWGGVGGRLSRVIQKKGINSPRGRSFDSKLASRSVTRRLHQPQPTSLHTREPGIRVDVGTMLVLGVRTEPICDIVSGRDGALIGIDSC